MKSELAVLKRYPTSKLSYFNKYFKITKHNNDSGFDYEVDVEKVEAVRRNKGFFLLFSTDMEANPSDLLYFYRAKDADEKLFNQIKNEIDGRRMRTHNEETTNGKTFVTFLACLLRAYMLRMLRRYLEDHSTSLKRVLNQLSDIVIVANEGKMRFTKALTKMQKDILACFSAEKSIKEDVKGL